MSGAIPFATEAWIKQLADACNSSPMYREAAKDWVGDVYFVVEAEGKLQHTVYMYLDVYRGECRQAYIPEDHTLLNPEVWLCGPVSAWKEVTEKAIDPLRALLTRKLSLKGSMTKAMRHSKATEALIGCAVSFKTVYPL